MQNAARDEFDTGSESDEVAETYNRESPSSYRESSSTYHGAGDSLTKSPTPPRLPSSFVSATSAADAAFDRISRMRSRLSSYTPSYEKPLYTSSPTEDALKDKRNTPFLSNFTKELKELSESPIRASYDYRNDIIKENDVNGAASAKGYLNR